MIKIQLPSGMTNHTACCSNAFLICNWTSMLFSYIHVEQLQCHKSSFVQISTFVQLKSSMSNVDAITPELKADCTPCLSCCLFSEQPVLFSNVISDNFDWCPDAAENLLCLSGLREKSLSMPSSNDLHQLL